MSLPTVSEGLFEKLCIEKGLVYNRIPEDSEKTADYFVLIGALTLVVEVKQLDPNDEDKKLSALWGTPNCPAIESPSNRVQGLLEDGYPQVKRSSKGQYPTMIVVYNNSGPWNWIDTFTVSKAMFGLFGFVYSIGPNYSITVNGHGYFGKRKLTKNSFRHLSVVGILKETGPQQIVLNCYHNPFAKRPIYPNSLILLSDEQYIHPNPHERGFVHWNPERIET